MNVSRDSGTLIAIISPSEKSPPPRLPLIIRNQHVLASQNIGNRIVTGVELHPWEHRSYSTHYVVCTFNVQPWSAQISSNQMKRPVGVPDESHRTQDQEYEIRFLRLIFLLGLQQIFFKLRNLVPDLHESGCFGFSQLCAQKSWLGRGFHEASLEQ